MANVLLNICSNHFQLRTFCFYFLFYFLSKVSANLDNCSFHAQLNRNIESLGFHRNIEYNFSLTTNCSLPICKVCLLEFIPSGMFVNKDQLDDLLRVGKLSASVDENIDIEAPASISSPILVRIFEELNLRENILTGNASLPAHIRYHDPQPGGGFRKIHMEQPELYVYCPGLPINLNEGIFLTKCAGNEKQPHPYRKVTVSMNEDSLLILEVPVGDSDSFAVVFAGTFSVVIAGSIYITGVLYKI